MGGIAERIDSAGASSTSPRRELWIETADHDEAEYGDDTNFSVDQIRFVNLIVDELTRNGVMEPTRLFEPPYTDDAPTGPDMIFPDADVDTLVRTLREIRVTASASDVA